MRQLLNDDKLSYSFGGYSVDETASANSEQLLKRGESVFIGRYSAKTVYIELSNFQSLTGRSRVFISLKPGKFLHSVKEWPLLYKSFSAVSVITLVWAV